MVSCSRILRPCRKRRKTKSNKVEAIELDDAHDECRLCLDPAVFRLCCGTWYCNQCYYKTGECPSCGDSTEGKAKAGQHKDKLGRIIEDLSSNKFQVFGTIFIKIIVWINIIGWPLSYFFSQVTNEETLHGYQCVGYLPPCKYELCVNMLGMLENKSLYTDSFDFCSSGDRCRKICSAACVIDERLYAKTHGKMGLDICKSSFNPQVVVLYDNFESGKIAGQGHTLNLKYGSDFNAEFVRGVNLVDDDGIVKPKDEINSDWSLYEGGNPSYRQSAMWDYIRNGNPLDLCGSSRGDMSLVFAGQKFRDATTYRLNLEYGGKITMSIKFGGFVFRDGTYDMKLCKPSFGGDLFVKYSLDNKATWTEIEQFSAQVYKTRYFSNVTIEIPEAAWSTQTYIMFEQRNFQRSEDYVAIDNLTIIANGIPADWETSQNWLEVREMGRKNDKEAQCCFNSRKCERGYGILRPDNPSVETCGKFSDYNFKEETQVATTGESFVTVWIICVLLGYAKRSYQSNGKMIYRILHCCKLHNPPPKISKMPSTKIIAERRKHKHTYLIENSESDKNTEVITFCPDVDPKWQSFFFFAVPITGTFFSGLAALRGYQRNFVQIDTATSLTSELESVMPLTYHEYFFNISFVVNDLALAILLVLIELPICWYASFEYVGNAFTRPPTFQILHRTDDLPKSELLAFDKLVIDGNEEYAIPMDSIMKTEEATILWTKLAAAGLVLSSFPFGLFLFCASEFLPSGVTLLIALFTTLKLYAGPMLLAHALLYYPWFVEIRQDNIHELANGCCSLRCLYVGGVLAAIGFPISLGVLAAVMSIDDFNFFNTSAKSIPPFMFYLFPLCMTLASFAFGGVIGWGRRFPMHGHFYMSAVREPLLVTYKNKTNYKSHENHPKADYLHQNTVLMCPVTDNYALGEAVRCETVEYERNIQEEFGKGYRAQLKLDLDYGTVLQSYEDFCKNVLLDLSRNIPCPLYGLKIHSVVDPTTVNFLVLDSDGVEAMGIFDKETQLKVRMVNDKSAYKADLEYKAEATFRTEKMQWANLEHFYGFPIQTNGRLVTAKKPLRLRGMEIIESESEGEDDEGDGEGGANGGGNAHEYAVGSAQIVVSGKISSEEEPSDDSLANDEEWGYGLQGQPEERALSPFSNDGDEANANIVLDNEEPEIKTMFKSYKGSHKNVSLMMYPEHIREMMASIQFSTSPLRQKQCRRPYCKKAFTDETNRGDVCSYHPGIRVFRVRPCVEGEEPTEGFDGVNEELWTCCGQPYVDFSKVEMEGSVGMPCTTCPHWG